MAQKKPVFVCIPGAWHGGWAYDLVRAELSKAGFRSTAVDLPNIVPLKDPKPAANSIFPDVDVVYNAIAEVLAEGDDVIPVCHSYGGMVMTETVGRLVADGKTRGESSGRILWIVYISAYPSLEELSLFGNAIPILNELGIEMKTVPYWDLQDGYCVPNREAGNYFLNDSSAAEQEKLVNRLEKLPLASLMAPTSSVAAGWRSVPSSFIITTQDLAIIPTIQTALIEKAVQSAQEQKGPVIPFSDPDVGRQSIDASHDCMLSQPAALKDLLVKVAEKAVGSA